jgi:hypothetical protein
MTAEPRRARRGTWAAMAAALAMLGYGVVFYACRMPSVERVWQRPTRRVDYVGELLAGLFGDFYVERWFGQPINVSILDRLGILLLATAILAWGAALGWLCLGGLASRSRLTRLETGVFSTALGMSLLSTYVLAVGLAGLLQYRVVFLLPALLTLLSAGLKKGTFWFFWKSRMSPFFVGDGPHVELADEPGVGRAWLWCVVPLAAVVLLGGMLPPTDFDVREYHLQAPKEFYQLGRITFLPHNVYADMPLGSEMFPLLAMSLLGNVWYGALVGKTVISAFALLTALALLAAGRRFFSPSAGVVAAIVYLSVPWILLVSVNGLVEGVLACYLLLAVYALLLDELPPRESCRIGWRGVAGFMAGSAAACKYPALLFVVVPVAVWMVLRVWRTDRSTLLKSVGIYLLAVTAGCGLWLGKNAVLTGNPTYPLLYPLFDGRTWTPEKDLQWNGVHRPTDYSLRTMASDASRVAVRSEWLSPLVVPLAVLALLRARQRRLCLALAGVCLFVLAAWWLLTHRIDRFWIPVMPILCLLAGCGGLWSGDAIWRTVLRVAMVFVAGVSFLMATSGAIGPYRLFLDLETLRVDPERVQDPWHLYFNQHVKQGKLLLVGEAQVFDFEVPILYATCFDDCPLETLAVGRTSQQTHDALREAGVSYAYVAWHEIQRYRARGNYGFSPFIRPELLDRLVADGVLEPLPPLPGHDGRGFRVK